MNRRELIELYKHPKNKKKLEGATHSAHVYNAVCGDDVTMYFLIGDGEVKDVSFTGTGCTICMASSSLLTEKMKGKTVEEIKKMDAKKITELLGMELTPTRLKCALVPLEAAHKGVYDED